MGPEKRLPLALFLCFVILFGWQLLTAEVETSPAGGADANESATPLLEDGGNAADAVTTPTDTDTVTPDGAPETTACLLYTSPSPRDKRQSRMPSSA